MKKAPEVTHRGQDGGMVPEVLMIECPGARCCAGVLESVHLFSVPVCLVIGNCMAGCVLLVVSKTL